MLRSENYDVRSYSTCAALLADPVSREYPCIVLDIKTHDIDSTGFLQEMRATGWHGRAILLEDLRACEGLAGESLVREADQHGDRIFDQAIGDRSLLAAIAALIQQDTN
jgi:DNA-binding response OmpR family regulator